MNTITTTILVIFGGTALLVVTAASACKPQEQLNGHEPQAQERPDGQQPQAQQSQSPKVRFDIAAQFTASGSMGDGEQGPKYIQLMEGWKDKPHSTPSCIKVIYSPGPNGWGGIYWQNKPDNWGDKPGEDFNHAGYKKLTFWARGETGDELIEFKAGGINTLGKQYKDSFEISAGKIQLEKEWKQYTLDLEGKNLSSVIGGFCWVAAKSANLHGATFYLDDIDYEH